MENIQKTVLLQLMLLGLMVICNSDSKAETDELSLVTPPSIECSCPDDNIVLNDLLLKAAGNTPDGYDSLLIDSNSLTVKELMGPPCVEFQVDPDSVVCAGVCKYSVRLIGQIRRRSRHSGRWLDPKEYIYPTPSYYTVHGDYVVSDSIWSYPCGDWRGIPNTVYNKYSKKRKLEKGTFRTYMNIYPNPLNSGNRVNVRLFSDVSDVAHLRIYDINGRESVSHRITMNVKEGMNDTQVDVSGLKPGIYSVTTYMNLLNIVRKELLIIQ